MFDTISTADGWYGFFSTGMTLSLDEQIIHFRWSNWGVDNITAECEGEVMKCSRPDLFSFNWYPLGKEYPVAVQFELVAKDGGCVVTVNDGGYPDTPEGNRQLVDCAQGWAEALTLLKFYLEHGIMVK